jgi:NAD(P)-dependent dehydrogenase (short-subunit alcohol dehydrogenase family)
MTDRSVANVVETTGRSEAAARESLASLNPQRRLIAPAEVTAAALWLCGPGSDGVNGQAIAINGGEA